eukprot:scaffold113534_cov53-Phaeocystis_antarctica.AAC.1
MRAEPLQEDDLDLHDLEALQEALLVELGAAGLGLRLRALLVAGAELTEVECDSVGVERGNRLRGFILAARWVLTVRRLVLQRAQREHDLGSHAALDGPDDVVEELLELALDGVRADFADILGLRDRARGEQHLVERGWVDEVDPVGVEVDVAVLLATGRDRLLGEELVASGLGPRPLVVPRPRRERSPCSVAAPRRGCSFPGGRAHPPRLQAGPRPRRHRVGRNAPPPSPSPHRRCRHRRRGSPNHLPREQLGMKTVERPLFRGCSVPSLPGNPKSSASRHSHAEPGTS